MATPDHTPEGRGYDQSLIYFHHANDYWQYTCGSCAAAGAQVPETNSAYTEQELLELSYWTMKNPRNDEYYKDGQPAAEILQQS